MVFTCAFATPPNKRNKIKTLIIGLIFFDLIPSNHIYKIGKTKSVNKVALIKPPITTVANGF